MRIDASGLRLASSHSLLQQRDSRESLRLWIDNPGQVSASTPLPPAAEKITLSEAAKAAQTGDSQATDQKREASLDPKMTLLKSVIEALTGRPIKLMDLTALQASAATELPPEASTSDQAAPNPTPEKAGYGIEYDRHESYREAEQTTFSAQGEVHTTDGKSIAFTLSLSMSRLYEEESNVSIRAGDAIKKDPLVLNFNGTAAQLTDQRFAFDIDADGKTDQINFVGSGSGFLVLDKNGDGKATNGSELFGTQSGDGFADLAAYDQDQNGWIDENDPVFNRLRLWSKDMAGQDLLSSLSDKGVGAIALGHLATPFDIKTPQNQLQASVLASGVFLQENGGVGSVQQLNLTV